MIKNLFFVFSGIILFMQSTSCKENNIPVGKELENREGQFRWGADVLNQALDANLVRWESDPNVNTEYTRYMVLYSGKALNYLSLVAFYDENNQHTEAASRVVEQLKYVISGGKEPCCRGVIAGWADNSLAQSIVLAKYTEKIWSQFNQKEREKLDLLMEALAIAGNYCQNSQNKVHRGLYQAFDWRKGWNPNHQEGYVGVMIAAWIYFGGAEQVNNIFSNFSYENYIDKFQNSEFENIMTCWQNTGKELMENGGTDSGGGMTKGVKIPFTYSSLSGFGEVEYEPYLLYRDLATRMYKYPVTSTECDERAYIADGTRSPYEHQAGMCYEFRTQDASGCRSSAGYCFDGWMNNVLTLATLQAFGLLPDEKEFNDIKRRISVGSADLIYKLRHGYHAYKNGRFKEEYEQDYLKLGIEFIKDIYKNTEQSVKKSKYVVFKFDDLRETNWKSIKTITDMIIKKDITADLGIFVQSLILGDEDYKAYVQSLVNDRRHFQIWLHGWTGTPKEFYNTNYDTQLDHFYKARTTMLMQYDYILRNYGPHYYGGNENTVRIINEDPFINGVIYKNKKGYTSEKQGLAPVNVRMEIEPGVISFERYLSNWSRLRADTLSYVVLQGHPWGYNTDSRKTELADIIDDLLAKGFTFTHLSDYYRLVKGYSTDTTPPSVPQRLKASRTEESYVSLSWKASMDSESGIDCYKIYRDGICIDLSATPSYIDKVSGNHTYQVSAVNRNDMVSAKSATATP